MAVRTAWFSSVMLETMPIRSGTEEGTWSHMLKASGAEQEWARCTLPKWLQSTDVAKTDVRTEKMLGARDDKAAGEPVRVCHLPNAQRY